MPKDMFQFSPVLTYDQCLEKLNELAQNKSVTNGLLAGYLIQRMLDYKDRATVESYCIRCLSWTSARISRYLNIARTARILSSEFNLPRLGTTCTILNKTCPTWPEPVVLEFWKKVITEANGSVLTPEFVDDYKKKFSYNRRGFIENIISSFETKPPQVTSSTTTTTCVEQGDTPIPTPKKKKQSPDSPITVKHIIDLDYKPDIIRELQPYFEKIKNIVKDNGSEADPALQKWVKDQYASLFI